MANSAIAALVFIVNTLAQLYLLVLLLRLLLPWMGVNFHNPIAQGILKLTSFLVVPVRRILPPIGRIDTATVVVAFGIQYLVVWLIGAIYGQRLGIVAIAIVSVVDLVTLTVKLFVFAILIRVLLSWLSPGNYNPAIGIISAITDPILRPIRRLIPPLGGLDLSPLFAMVALVALSILLEGLKPALLGSLT